MAPVPHCEERPQSRTLQEGPEGFGLAVSPENRGSHTARSVHGAALQEGPKVCYELEPR